MTEATDAFALEVQRVNPQDGDILFIKMDAEAYDAIGDGEMEQFAAVLGARGTQGVLLYFVRPGTDVILWQKGVYEILARLVHTLSEHPDKVGLLRADAVKAFQLMLAGTTIEGVDTSGIRNIGSHDDHEH